jgi:hypothetical protein
MGTKTGGIITKVERGCNPFSLLSTPPLRREALGGPEKGEGRFGTHRGGSIEGK